MNFGEIESFILNLVQDFRDDKLSGSVTIFYEKGTITGIRPTVNYDKTWLSEKSYEKGSHLLDR